MKRYPDRLVRKTRLIRKKEKLSYAELGRRFNIPQTTIRNWCFDIKVGKKEALSATNERKRKLLKQSEISVLPQKELLSQDFSKFLAAILYGCEGSKYPGHSGVAFVNSNPNLVLAFLNLLRKSFNLDENKYSVHLQIHTTHNFKEVVKFWSQLLNLPESCFIKPTVTNPRGGKHRRNYWGTCSLRYRDYRIQLKLLGIYERFVEVLSKERK